MRFALNYSPQAVELLQAGEINVDLFKCPDWPDLVETAAATRPVYVHFPLFAGDGSIHTTDWAKVERLLARTQTRYINLHLGPRLPDFPELAGDPAATERLLEQVLTDIEVVTRRFGPERCILENVPYQGDSDAYHFAQTAIEPAFIREVLEATGCGLLLDLSHARLSAWYVGWDELTYLDALPVEHIRELHVTGIRMVNGRLSDHMGLTDADWEVVSWAFSRIDAGKWTAPDVVALEYGGVGPRVEWRSDASVIAADVPRLYNLVRGLRV